MLGLPLWMWSLPLILWLGPYIPVVPGREVTRCEKEADCPPGALCFRDECARCLCRNGTVLDQLYDGGTLTEICHSRSSSSTRVGDRCMDENQCPYGSSCLDNICRCRPGLVPDDRFASHCRQPRFGEVCDADHPCDSLMGFACIIDHPPITEHPGEKHELTLTGTCGCRASHHRPTQWSRFVLGRWDYARVESDPQDCVARAVGEPCKSNAECAAVEGSGSVCGDCGYCQCRKEGHVPDILGTKCGPGKVLGQRCSLQSRHVCDGTLGLQCGDVCDLYSTSTTKRSKCTCSQMHERRGNQCIPKDLGSSCGTDLDCYQVKEGYGYCNRGRCHANLTIPSGYSPNTVDRTCLLKRLPPQSPGDSNADQGRPPPSDGYDGIIVPGGPGNASYSVKQERSQQDSSYKERKPPGGGSGTKTSHGRPKAVTGGSVSSLHAGASFLYTCVHLVVSVCVCARR